MGVQAPLAQSILWVILSRRWLQTKPRSRRKRGNGLASLLVLLMAGEQSLPQSLWLGSQGWPRWQGGGDGVSPSELRHAT